MTRLATSPAEQREMADRSEQEDGEIRPNNCRQAQKHGQEHHLEPLPHGLKQHVHTIEVTDRYYYNLDILRLRSERCFIQINSF